MIRGLAALAAIAAIVALAGFLADRPGHVEIVWQDWQLDTSVGVLAGAVAAVTVALWGIVSALTTVVHLPQAWRRRRRLRRDRAGQRALARGMVALASGDAPLARRQAARAVRFLPGAPLTLLLSAQAARAADDGAAARRAYAAMLDEPPLALVGLRGLLDQALQEDDRVAALELAARARRLNPKAPWLGDHLLALETRAGHWEEAAATLADMARYGRLSPARARHQRGVLLHQQSCVAEAAGELGSAARLAARAQALTPNLAEPACHHARLLLALGRKRAATRAIERAWRAAAHPTLATVYAALHAEESALARVGAFQRLASHNPEAAESHLAIAEAALAVQLWGEARHHLTRAAAIVAPALPSRRLCLLMAEVEQREHPGGGDTREWVARALAAPPDPVYVCATCAGESAEWHALCPKCGGLDALAWRVPPHPPPGVTPAPALPTLASPTAAVPLPPPRP